MDESVAVKALRELADVLAATAPRLDELVHRARTLADQVESGTAWRDAVAEEERPLIVERLTEIIDMLAGYGSAFRRAEARVLNRQGLSQERIAALFGVTRQRVGALLAEEPSRRRAS